MDCPRIAPWSIFVAASQANDVHLAKAALKEMKTDYTARHINMDSLAMEKVSQVSLPFLLGLIRAISCHPEQERE